MSQSRSFNEPQVIGQYRLIKTIGKGNFAKVKLARHLPTDRLVVVKFVAVILQQDYDNIIDDCESYLANFC